MSQLGMQMPGAQRSRRPSMNIYTGVLFFTVVALAAALAMVYMNARQIAPGDDPLAPLKVHEEGRITLPSR